MQASGWLFSHQTKKAVSPEPDTDCSEPSQGEGDGSASINVFLSELGE